MLMLCGILASAQNRVVSGKVIDKEGTSVPFASIKVKGTKIGTQADALGSYNIKIKDGDVLEISAANFKTIDAPVGTQPFLTSVLEKTGNLTEVVVTSAFGIKRAGRTSASNFQNISSEQLNTVRSANINNALAGKVAGAQVRSQSAGKLGSETTVRLRGENGFLSGSGPIYVVDGTIIPSSGDINNDDVEDITVLQGPAAAALFGADGSNGAIVITTKKAKKSQKALGNEINSGITFEKVYVVPNYQNTYAGGDDNSQSGQVALTRFDYQPGQPDAWKLLDGKYYINYKNDASWGPKMVGQDYIPWYAWYPGSEYAFKTTKLVPQPNNVKDFYNTGVTMQNNINLSKAGDGYNFRLSYTNLDIKGILPNSFLKRHTLNANFSIDLDPKLTAAVNFNYIAQNSNSENEDGYGNQSSGSFSSWFHRNLEIDKLRELSGLKSPTGGYASWNHLNPEEYDPEHPEKFYNGNYWFNHYSYFKEVSTLNRRDRLFGDASLSYKITNDLRIKGTYRLQQLTTGAENIYPTLLQNSISQSQFNSYDAINGSNSTGNAVYATGNSYSNRQNYELIASYTKKLKNFNINALAGLDILKTYSRVFNANTVGGLNIPDLYTLANSVKPIANSLRGDQQLVSFSKSLRRSLFVSTNIGYKNYLFLEGTFRRDYISTEPVSKPYIDTKSIGASFLFSDLLKEEIPFLSYGKLRASTGQILNALGIYQTNVLYSPLPNQWTGNFIISEPNTLVDPSLRGAVNNEKEIGLDLRFLKNRVGVSVTYWDRTNKRFPANVSISATSGYTALSTNVGEIKKTGIDIQILLRPIVTKNLEWTLTGTWGKLVKNDVISIAPGVDRLNFSSGAGAGAYAGSYAPIVVSTVGQRWGQLFGKGIARNASGTPILDANGLYTFKTGINFGSVLPDYTGGVQNSFNVFKNFTISVNIDYSMGGKFFSLSQFWGTASGLTARTAEINDKGNSVRDAVADGGGVRVTGVDESNKPVVTYVDAYKYFHQFQNVNQVADPFISDLTFVKMRELSMGYKIPMSKLKLGKTINSATFSILIRNPWLIYSKTKDFDPSEISGVQGEDGQFPGTRSIGVNLKLGF